MVDYAFTCREGGKRGWEDKCRSSTSCKMVWTAEPISAIAITTDKRRTSFVREPKIRDYRTGGWLSINKFHVNFYKRFDWIL